MSAFNQNTGKTLPVQSDLHDRLYIQESQFSMRIYINSDCFKIRGYVIIN